MLPLILLPCLAASPAASTTPAPATAPATDPATAPVVEMLDQGRVRLVAPAGWTLAQRKSNGMSLRYAVDGGKGVVTIVVTPQHAPLGRDAVAKMTQAIGEQLREAARNEGATFVIPPRVEPDERFLLKVRDRTRGADGKARDQLQVYRVMQSELVHVAVVATVETEAESAPIFAAAEEMLDRAKLGAGPKPSAFRRTRVRLTIPTDWIEQRTDDPNGVVATYANPAMPGARLVVRSKVIPRDARRDPQVREHALDELVDAYRHGSIPDGATTRGEEEKFDHPLFRRYVQRSLTWNDGPWATEFRCVVVGDVAIGVEALVPPLDKSVTRLADEMARTVKSLDDKRLGGDLELSPAVAPAVRQMRPPSTQPGQTRRGDRPGSVRVIPPSRAAPSSTTRPR